MKKFNALLSIIFCIILFMSFMLTLSLPIQIVNLAQGVVCKIVSEYSLEWNPYNTKLIASTPAGLIISNRDKDGHINYAIGGIFGFNSL